MSQSQNHRRETSSHRIFNVSKRKSIETNIMLESQGRKYGFSLGIYFDSFLTKSFYQ